MDDRLFELVNAFARATPWLHSPIGRYAGYGMVAFALLLVAGWWSARRSGKPGRVAAAVCGGVATLLAVGVNQPVVEAVHRARPYTVHPDALVLATRSTDFSFPSDHAVMAGAVAVGLVFVARWLAAVAAVAAVAMAFARVYIAAHFPLDVVAGLLLGAVVALVIYFAAHRWVTSAVAALAASRSRLRPLVVPVSAPSAAGSAGAR